MCYLCPKDIMNRKDFEAVGRFSNKDGDLYSAARAEEWATYHVRLEKSGMLKLRLLDGTVRSTKDLLARFLRLAEASNTDIAQFVSTYGALGVFWEFVPKHGDCRRESCAVYRYFAAMMLAILRMASAVQAGRPCVIDDWKVIAQASEWNTRKNARMFAPQEEALRGWILSSQRLAAETQTFPEFYTINLNAARYYLGLQLEKLLRLSDAQISFEWGDVKLDNAAWLKAQELNAQAAYELCREMAERGASDEESEAALNSLIAKGGVANVRRFFIYETSRPKLRFETYTMFGYLVLQLCLRVAGIESFVVCSHCHTQYTPVVRAPKMGQRNFCPECRKNKIPRLLATRDSRERRRLAGTSPR